MIYEKLANFLSKHPKTENGKHTHTIYGGDYGGSYTIPQEEMNNFYKIIYCFYIIFNLLEVMLLIFYLCLVFLCLAI